MGTVEAMQLGLVPVVTPVGETGSYVVDGENGIIVDTDILEVAISRVETVLSNAHHYQLLRGRAIATWQTSRLYHEDICRAALAVTGRSSKGEADIDLRGGDE